MGEQTVNGWTPVTDSLPNNGRPVAVAYRGDYSLMPETAYYAEGVGWFVFRDDKPLPGVEFWREWWPMPDAVVPDAEAQMPSREALAAAMKRMQENPETTEQLRARVIEAFANDCNELLDGVPEEVYVPVDYSALADTLQQEDDETDESWIERLRRHFATLDCHTQNNSTVYVDADTGSDEIGSVPGARMGSGFPGQTGDIAAHMPTGGSTCHAQSVQRDLRQEIPPDAAQATFVRREQIERERFKDAPVFVPSPAYVDEGITILPADADKPLQAEEVDCPVIYDGANW